MTSIKQRFLYKHMKEKYRKILIFLKINLYIKNTYKHIHASHRIYNEHAARVCAKQVLFRKFITSAV